MKSLSACVNLFTGSGVSHRGAACVRVWPSTCYPAAGARRQLQRLEQSGPEGLAQEEVDERVQQRV